ncbi:MAG TPA: hypothetical protein VGK24_11135 [Candidatus Angelobacter sp.]|jgi:hypothetical protein
MQRINENGIQASGLNHGLVAAAHVSPLVEINFNGYEIVINEGGNPSGVLKIA